MSEAITIVGMILISFVMFMAGRGHAKSEQAKADARAREIADDIQGDIGAIPPDAARKELGERF